MIYFLGSRPGSTMAIPSPTWRPVWPAADRLRSHSQGFFQAGDLRGYRAPRLIQALADRNLARPVSITSRSRTPGGEVCLSRLRVMISPGRSAPWDQPDFQCLSMRRTSRGMKFSMTHTTTRRVIIFAECEARKCPYRASADYPQARGARRTRITRGSPGPKSARRKFPRLTYPNYPIR